MKRLPSIVIYAPVDTAGTSRRCDRSHERPTPIAVIYVDGKPLCWPCAHADIGLDLQFESEGQ